MSTVTRWIGLDVGGANIKASDGIAAVSTPFPLWKNPQGLADAVRKTIGQLPQDHVAADQRYAATMTGELADCYASKSEGVRAILDALTSATDSKPLWIATNDDTWVRPTQAAAEPLTVAAANWRLFARWASQAIGRRDALVIDVGSTTTDVTRVVEGRIHTIGSDDTTRLASGELLYAGVRRTPLCAVVDSAPYRGELCRIAAELFATTGDAWLMLGELPASPRTDTADGAPFDHDHAVTRLARCFCADRDSFTPTDAELFAHHIADVQTENLSQAIMRTDIDPHTPLVAAGEGEFLVHRAQKRMNWQGELLAVSSITPETASECGPAWAASHLAAVEVTEALHTAT